MSKYYRERDGIKLAGRWSEVFESIEVDEWHPASEPPTPGDFEPTGLLLVRSHEHHYWTGTQQYLAHETYTHWMHITPPK